MNENNGKHELEQQTWRRLTRRGGADDEDDVWKRNREDDEDTKATTKWREQLRVIDAYINTTTLQRNLVWIRGTDIKREQWT
jgi:hypothetical protein